MLLLFNVIICIVIIISDIINDIIDRLIIVIVGIECVQSAE